MADFATLERQIEMQTEERPVARQMTAEEAEHCSRIAENYRKLILEGAAEYCGETPAASVAETEERSTAAQRIADYYTVAPDPARHALFENYTYREGQLVEERPTDRVVSAPVAAPVAAPAASDEDAVPTRETMNTLRADSARKTDVAAEAASVGFFKALAPKVKMALAIVAVAIVAVLTLVIVNAFVLRSLDGSIAQNRLELTRLTERSEEIYGQIDSITSDEYVDAWAADHDMFRE